ncbi:phosphoglucosamine mutase [Tenuifilum sp.]|uniref:phosphoglucosamine mutase n=1 Tax=Tenuifilum sp. TaxID=2760880 RepID=UPI001B620F56|nr:phosphoglucosamine mutase [Bacteroidales bacterium]HOU75403.1 phosphoglucosamine mutase [Tenuifilum sp.]MBP9029074.1 phosphoglucosamine mutase [Bacteroidales bacterium]HQE55556.1 phosphoglucosamine mutase [Tenuifilum sp.]HQG73208.1 phosphoglucosamine mutase [Tenuifilum sp.]
MTLIKSISGIRGTIGGRVGENLTPVDIVRFTAAYAEWLKQRNNGKRYGVAVGRDARISGEMVNNLVIGTLMGCGIDVLNLGLATTPTVEMAVIHEKTDGGIILTASHNPRQWNALKLLNEKGEFLSDTDGRMVLEIARSENFSFTDVEKLGAIHDEYSFVNEHIEQIIKLKYVDVDAISNANFKVAIDCVNSVGGIALPRLLKALGVKNIVELYTDPTGDFPHNPEPLPEHLTEISKVIQEQKADVGFVVDPDVDRLAIINEDGSMFGEEYTLVACADYVLSQNPGNTVSNLSSTVALRDITHKYGKEYFASAVGEVNVVTKMKEVNAIIGGEGNGGVILPELHYGRDALVGIALFLSHLAKSRMKCTELRRQYPSYFISKNKIELKQGLNPDAVLERLKEKFSTEKINTIDGLRIDFAEGWVHMRKSNTEPIIRIYAEAQTAAKANELAQQIIKEATK